MFEGPLSPCFGIVFGAKWVVINCVKRGGGEVTIKEVPGINSKTNILKLDLCRFSGVCGLSICIDEHAE